MPCKPDFASDLPLGRISSLADRVHELETRESVIAPTCEMLVAFNRLYSKPKTPDAYDAFGVF